MSELGKALAAALRLEDAGEPVTRASVVELAGISKAHAAWVFNGPRVEQASKKLASRGLAMTPAVAALFTKSDRVGDAELDAVAAERKALQELAVKEATQENL